jgi:hypothetical protein
MDKAERWIELLQMLVLSKAKVQSMFVYQHPIQVYKSIITNL